MTSNDTNEKLINYAKKQMSDAGFTAIGELYGLDGIKSANGGKLCLGTECLDRNLWDIAPAIKPLSVLGVHASRLQTGWARTEKTVGVYDFSELENEVDSLIGAGITPWLSLSYGNPLYFDGDKTELLAGGIGHVPIKTERERNAWCAYVAECVRRFRGRVKKYEIWNEPDVSVFFPAKETWVKDYAELIRLTAPIIRENDENAEIVVCTGHTNGFLPLLKQGIAEYADCYSFHNYTSFPELQTSEYRNALCKIRDKYAPNLKIIRGEAGCPSYNAPTSKGALHGMKTSEEIQAKWVGRHLIPDLADRTIAQTSYFHAYDFLHFSRLHHYYYGILREDYSRKPSFGVLQLLCHLFDGDTVENPESCMSFYPIETPKTESLSADATKANASDYSESDYSESELARARAYSFTRRGVKMYAYYSAKSLSFEGKADVAGAEFFPKASSGDLILVNTLSRELYRVKVNENGKIARLPITEYPLILCEASALGGLCALDFIPKSENHAESVKQYSEE